jgi:hypothetical protein
VTAGRRAQIHNRPPTMRIMLPRRPGCRRQDHQRLQHAANHITTARWVRSGRRCLTCGMPLWTIQSSRASSVTGGGEGDREKHQGKGRDDTQTISDYYEYQFPFQIPSLACCPQEAESGIRVPARQLTLPRQSAPLHSEQLRCGWCLTRCFPFLQPSLPRPRAQVGSNLQRHCPSPITQDYVP